MLQNISEVQESYRISVRSREVTGYQLGPEKLQDISKVQRKYRISVRSRKVTEYQ
jgi:hypothetical protein